MTRQELLEFVRESNLRENDKLKIETERYGVQEYTFQHSYFAEIHQNRYGERKATRSTGTSYRVASITITDYRCGLYTFGANEIVSIEFLGNNSRRRKNPYTDVADYEEE